MKEANITNQMETQWIDMARLGDLTAFNQLVLANQNVAFRVACWMLNDDTSAEDVVQTVFLAAYREIQRFKGNSFRNWLLRMIHNACIDEIRRRKRHPWLAFEVQGADDEEVEMARWMIDPGFSPEETYIQRESWQRVERCLDLLPDPMREVIVLIDLEELDYEEAAAVLGLPVGTIKSRISRARARLRQILCGTWSRAGTLDIDVITRGVLSH